MKGKSLSLTVSLVWGIVAAFCVAPVAHAWNHGMHYPQLPDPYGWGICLPTSYLADDFECTVSGEITDIHFWYVWKGGAAGGNPVWEITIYEDCGGFPCPFPAWTWTGQGNISQTNAGLSWLWWYCWDPYYFYYHGEWSMYRVDITDISPGLWQVEGRTYWLVIRATGTDGTPGWVTTLSAPWGSCARYWNPVLLRWECIDQNPNFSFVITKDATGACCNNFTGECMDDVELENCQPPLRFVANTLCADLDPPCGGAFTGACCNWATYECYESEEDECLYEWLGAGTDCGMCQGGGEFGACCNWETYDCYESEEYECLYEWLGPGTDCGMCQGGGEFGACCYPGGECMEETESVCIARDGMPQGPDSMCTVPEACCLPGGECTETDPLCCDELGGMPSPIGEPVCLGDGDNNGIDDACEEPCWDNDGDGYEDEACGGDDCDDTRNDVYPTAPELCDGVDNDCDGLVDSEDPDMEAPLCELQQGVCAGAKKKCANGMWEPCGPEEYGPDYEPEETLCDGLDNDCDGELDEGCGPTDCVPRPDGQACEHVECPDSAQVCLPRVIRILEPQESLPPGGTDVLDPTNARLVLVNPLGAENIALSGPTVVERGDPYDSGERNVIDTEIVALDLVGASSLGPVRLTQAAAPPQSLGQHQGGYHPGPDFPAESFFDVYVELELPDIPATLHSDGPVRLEASGIMNIPPLGEVYETPPDWLPVQLLDSSGQPTGFSIEKLTHYMPPEYKIVECECIDPGECHVEFEPAECVVPDNGTGTADMPPEGCNYHNDPDGDKVKIVEGLPVGNVIEIDVREEDFRNVERRPGGLLGGIIVEYNSQLAMTMVGTGPDVGGFNRELSLALDCEVHTGPRNPGDPVQSFDTEMVSMSGELMGDPDFAYLHIAAQTVTVSNPGHTTLTQLPSGDFAVDSFFDITYQIEFEGAEDGQLAGYAGTTESRVRISTGDVGGEPVCVGGCMPGQTCDQIETINGDGTIDVMCDCQEVEPFLRIGPWMNPEQWHGWIGPCGQDERPVQVQLHILDSGHMIDRVEFYYMSSCQFYWTHFYTDTDGSEPDEDSMGYSPLDLGDGWSAYFQHELAECDGPISFKAEAYNAAGELITDTGNDRVYDSTPPCSVTLQDQDGNLIEDWYTLESDTLVVDVVPGMADISYALAYVVEKPEEYIKGIPGISQQPHSKTHCAPTAAAACLKYFEGQGDDDICGGLDDHGLVDELAGRSGTNQGRSGTRPSDLANGMRGWINDHGGGYTVRGPKSFNAKELRDELERSQDVLVGIYWDNSDAGHRMTLNSIRNRPVDGFIKIDAMDPWEGKIREGWMNPNTGHVSGWTGTSGNSGTLGNIIIVCPEESAPNGDPPGGGDPCQPGPDPGPIPIPIPHGGMWFLNVIVVDQQNHAARFIRIIDVILPDYGDAPEGAEAYPSVCVPGAFPTCRNIGPAGWVQHNSQRAYFGPTADIEGDGNAGLCPVFTNQYDQDECFADGDAGLIRPEPFTIVGPAGAETVQPCPGSAGTSLGRTCENAAWGVNMDIEVHNHRPNDAVAYVNVLADWDKSGSWGGSMDCAGVAVPEHILVDFPVPAGFDGPLSLLAPPDFTIGPYPGYIWVRFTITDKPVMDDPTGVDEWEGDGTFNDGETEDYLVHVDKIPVVIDCDWNEDDPHKMHWAQLPDLRPTGIDVDMFWTPLADDFECAQSGIITDVHFWASFVDDCMPPAGPGSLTLQLTIYDNIAENPDSPMPWSRPGEPLWGPRVFRPGQYTVRQVAEDMPEGWYDPVTNWYAPGNHFKAFQYNICIEQEPFVQQRGKIYWLEIQDLPRDDTRRYTFGWKTTLASDPDLRWNDDAVWWNNSPDRGPIGWLPLKYPDGHEYQGTTLDLAFVITGEEIAEACCLDDGTCLNLLPSECQGLGGQPLGPGTMCSGTIEACCSTTGECFDADPLCCQLMGGIPQGPGTICTEPEACCLSGGACINVDPLCCDEMGGMPQGPGTMCTVPEGCCLPDGTCINVDPLCCDDMGGVRQGAGNLCSGVTIACCLDDGGCVDVDPLCCDDMGGVPSPIGAPACMGDLNGNGIDDACEEPLVACCLPAGDEFCTEGGTCGNYESCGNATVGECICGTLSDGRAMCMDNKFCEELIPCPNGMIDCPAGEYCVVDTCCTDPYYPDVCLPPCPEPGIIPSSVASSEAPAGGGQTAAGSQVGTGSIGLANTGIGAMTCIQTTESDCIARGGIPQESGSMCTEPEGCCLPDGECVNVDPLCCDDMGGIPQGPGTMCTQPEGCCLDDGTCINVDPLCCDELGGTPQGPDTRCTQPEGCCLDDGACVDVDPLCCDELGGTPQGPGTQCSANTVACCLNDGGCVDVDPLCCYDLGGVPSPIGAPACMGDLNGNGVDDACEEPEPEWYNVVRISCMEPLLGGYFVFSLIPPVETPPCEPIPCMDAYVSCQIDCTLCQEMPCVIAMECIREQLLMCINRQGGGWRASPVGPDSILIEGPVRFDKCIWSEEMQLPPDLGLPLTPECIVNNVCNGIPGDEMFMFPHTNGYDFHVIEEPCACLGDMDGDGWLSSNDVSELVSVLLPHKSNYYWTIAPPGSCGDMDGDGWLSSNDVSELVSVLLPYKSSYYWKPCP